MDTDTKESDYDRGWREGREALVAEGASATWGEDEAVDGAGLPLHRHAALVASLGRANPKVIGDDLRQIALPALVFLSRGKLGKVRRCLLRMSALAEAIMADVQPDR